MNIGPNGTFRKMKWQTRENTTAKFSRRFRAVEAGAKEQGKKLKEMTLEEMDALWDAAKRDERA